MDHGLTTYNNRFWPEPLATASHFSQTTIALEWSGLHQWQTAFLIFAPSLNSEPTREGLIGPPNKLHEVTCFYLAPFWCPHANSLHQGTPEAFHFSSHVKLSHPPASGVSDNTSGGGHTLALVSSEWRASVCIQGAGLFISTKSLSNDWSSQTSSVNVLCGFSFPFPLHHLLLKWLFAVPQSVPATVLSLRH